jgi:hypothetical protein
MLIGGEAYREQLEENLFSSRQFICYSAFFTETAAQWLLKKRNFSNEDRLLIRALPADFAAGACSFAAIRFVLKSGLSVRMSSALHAKIYAFDDCVFAGSANLTAKGLALTENYNQELGTRSELEEKDRALLDHLWSQGTLLDEAKINKMEEFLRNSIKISVPVSDLSVSWPSHIIHENRDLYCSDFPQDYPSDDIRWSSESSLKETLAYKWLRDIIRVEGDARFGFLSSELHDVIYDDPAPYRREIKTLLANLLEAIKYLDVSELEVFRPNHSQVVRLRSDLMR